MKAVVVTIETQQPILVTSFQGDPNSDVSYSFIPGSAIRGALIGRYLKRHGLGNSDIVSDPAIRSLFFDGTTRYLNAYLYNEHNRQRTLPTPSSWCRDKYARLSETMRVYDLSQSSDLPEELSPRSVSEPFCVVSGRSVRLHRDKRRINVHNQRNRRKGRATEESGEIFRYDALDAGQAFQFIVLCDREASTKENRAADVAEITKLLKPTDIWIGGSQTAGYGHCKIIDVNVIDNWNEVDQPIQDRVDDRRLQITLLSPLIVRNIDGQYLTTSPTELLAQKLGCSLELHQSFASREYVGGFNRKWGLPLPQISAIAAGSVFVYSVDKDTSVDSATLSALEAQGIGERRVDGFGRIAFNWLGEESQFTASKPQARSYEEISLTSESQSIAEAMAIRLLRKRLDSYLLGEIGRYIVTSAPTNSQLSRLMLTARKALLEVQSNTSGKSEQERLSVSCQTVKNLLNELPPKASRQFEQARISNLSLKKQIEDWLDNPDDWLTHPPSATVANSTQSPTNLLKREYTLHLIMAVAKKAMKEENND